MLKISKNPWSCMHAYKCIQSFTRQDASNPKNTLTMYDSHAEDILEICMHLALTKIKWVLWPKVTIYFSFATGIEFSYISTMFSLPSSSSSATILLIMPAESKSFCIHDKILIFWAYSYLDPDVNQPIPKLVPMSRTWWR